MKKFFIIVFSVTLIWMLTACMRIDASLARDNIPDSGSTITPSTSSQPRVETYDYIAQADEYDLSGNGTADFFGFYVDAAKANNEYPAVVLDLNIDGKTKTVPKWANIFQQFDLHEFAVGDFMGDGINCLAYMGISNGRPEGLTVLKYKEMNEDTVSLYSLEIPAFGTSSTNQGFVYEIKYVSEDQVLIECLPLENVYGAYNTFVGDFSVKNADLKKNGVIRSNGRIDHIEAIDYNGHQALLCRQPLLVEYHGDADATYKIGFMWYALVWEPVMLTTGDLDYPGTFRIADQWFEAL